MINFIKRLFRKKRVAGACPRCGGLLISAKQDVSETYGRPVKVCAKCRKLVEV